MYIPVSYWQAQGGGIPHMKVNYFANNASTFNYNYNATTYTTSNQSGRVILPVCLDSFTNANTEKPQIDFLQAGASYFCTAAISGTIDINTPPQTGPEAWYIEVKYPRDAAFDLGTMYFNYINQNGIIVNDTLTQAQVKKTIISQSNPLFVRADTSFFENFANWTVIEKFPGQVLQYQYYNVPCTYTFQLKVSDPTNPGQYVMPYFTYASGSNNIGQITGSYVSSLNATIDIIANNPPVDANTPNDRNIPSVWITSIVPV